MRNILATVFVGLLFSAAAPVRADDDVDASRLQKDVGQLLADYQRGLRPRIGAMIILQRS